LKSFSPREHLDPPPTSVLRFGSSHAAVNCIPSSWDRPLLVPKSRCAALFVVPELASIWWSGHIVVGSTGTVNRTWADFRITVELAEKAGFQANSKPYICLTA